MQRISIFEQQQKIEWKNVYWKVIILRFLYRMPLSFFSNRRHFSGIQSSPQIFDKQNVIVRRTILMKLFFSVFLLLTIYAPMFVWAENPTIICLSSSQNNSENIESSVAHLSEPTQHTRLHRTNEKLQSFLVEINFMPISVMRQNGKIKSWQMKRSG